MAKTDGRLKKMKAHQEVIETCLEKREKQILMKKRQ
jgi:hypothetical protein